MGDIPWRIRSNQSRTARPVLSGADATSGQWRHEAPRDAGQRPHRKQAFDRVLDCIRRHDPDLVVLEEVDARWMADLESLHLTYPHILAEPRGDNFGIALFSKLPFQQSEIVWPGEARVPSLLAKCKVGNQDLTVLGTHSLPAVGARGWALRNNQLVAIPPLLAREANGSEPVLLLGDLNASPWCPAFRRLVRETGLCDSGRGFGVQPTWPTPMYLSSAKALLLSIPIDHCLVSPDLHVTKRMIGEDIGSDHLPLIVDVAFTGSD